MPTVGIDKYTHDILKELKQKFKDMGINKDMSDIIREAVEEMQRRIKMLNKIRNETVFAIAYMVGFACRYYSYQYPQVVEKIFFAILYAFSIVGVIALVIILFVLWRNRHVSPKG